MARCPPGSKCIIKTPACIPGVPCPGPVGECTEGNLYFPATFCHNLHSKIIQTFFICKKLPHIFQPDVHYVLLNFHI